ncbi:hypothetical protein [Campylobacter majalis]|uniref:hypothetical protein n=1 Tax=Campylobacter majalis TaxID=2790656 RepID=UPI003D698207
MLCKRAKEIIKLKSASGIKLPDDEILSELFLEAMLWVASKCSPNELLERYRSPNMRVFRNLGDDVFIRIPKKPNFNDENEHLEIDESLSYAVINEVLFRLNKEPFYRQIALEIIGDYVANDAKVIDVF